MRLSIVTTMYMSEPYVLEFYRRARAAADKITPDVEIIFVDDGSPDAALQQAVSRGARRRTKSRLTSRSSSWIAGVLQESARGGGQNHA